MRDNDDRARAGTDWQEAYVGGSQRAEAGLITRFVYDVGRVQNDLRERSAAARFRRAFHAKMHAGITNAEFRIAEDLPEDLHVGLFRPGAVYGAIVRLSNAAGVVQADGERDMRGLAMRVDTGPGEGHDFLATNSPASHARDARQFMIVAKAMAGSRLLLLPRLLFGLGAREAVRMVRTLRRDASQPVDSMATTRFWSRAPIAFGPYAVKFSFDPPTTAEPGRWGAGDDYLREDLVNRLKVGPIVYDFRIQVYVDRVRTPIEDAVVEWLEADAPSRTIAQLIIPQQDLSRPDPAKPGAAVDDIAFSPWNTSPEFRPLGSLNRARQRVYLASQDLRAGRRRPHLRSAVAAAAIAATAGVLRLVNRVVDWHRLPGLIGAFNLMVFREELRRDNLHDTEPQGPAADPRIKAIPPTAAIWRRSDGRYNDLAFPNMGQRGARFGRNVPVDRTRPDAARLMSPNPRLISRRLMTREGFIPATTLNLLAAAWIQFMTHGWFNHSRPPPERRGEQDFHEIPLPEDDDWPQGRMRVVRTPRHEIAAEDADAPPAYANTVTHWWDGSQIYGSTDKRTDRLRAHSDGKMAVGQNGLLPFNPENGIEHTGFNDNWWVGLSLLHTIFVLEHNAICDSLRAEYPGWNDERLFQTARLINAALMAKIHTVEWTPGILGHPALQIGMNANWWGLAGEARTRALGRMGDTETFGGIPGSPVDHHAAPYALTEEFVTVYRMHPLMPDDFAFYRHADGTFVTGRSLREVAGRFSREVLDAVPMSDLFYSFGIAHPGAITLHNFPKDLQHFERDDGELLDVAAIDILRDRERGVPRYNDFRELLHKKRVTRFEELTPNPRWAEELREVYGNDIDQVDAVVGMLAEPPPPGFGFSDTAFRIFILMASRRLKSDRFFTTDYTPDVYTPLGLEWINRNDMRSVIVRHYPELTPALLRTGNAFAPWSRTAPGA